MKSVTHVGEPSVTYVGDWTTVAARTQIYRKDAKLSKCMQGET